ncbi:MAG: tryptophan 2,3-dioxygenase [Candidatus Eremiobacteraeota bacterium]|nr:tryptophan 2,3-dioxygenase [Candidatus Eremiobacteraeota bacterium]
MTGAVPRTQGGLTYGEYLKVPELLSLQIPQSSPPHHDEMLFIIIHQAYELWFKLILHEMERAIEFMKMGRILRANHFVRRIVEVMKLLVKQIHILETMTPAEFLGFRDRLMPASGFQSVQFRELEFLAGLKNPAYVKAFRGQPDLQERLQRRLDGPSLRGTYYRLLRDLGYDAPALETQQENEEHQEVMGALVSIYQDPDQNLPLYLLSESLVEFDLQLGLWRQHHVKVVARSIGYKPGTGGSEGVSYLESTTTKQCFPYLWEVRTYLEKQENL